MNQRSRIIVNLPLQKRIIFSVSWPPLLCVMGTGIVFLAYAIRLGFEAAESDANLPSLLPVLVSAMCFLVMATGLVLWNALRFSHKVAGPMYRIGKTLQAVRAGDPSVRARLRNGDHLEDLAQEINEFLDWLEEREITLAADESDKVPLEVTR